MAAEALEINPKPEDPLIRMRKQCLLCPLPQDFLRVLPYNEDLYERGAVARTDRHLELAIIEARLNKHYSLISMGLYCRIRLGDSRYETRTASNSSKHPIWNESFLIPFHPAPQLSLVVMNESMLMSNSKIAWTMIPLPQTLLDGGLVDMWYELNGNHGQDVEGSIHVSMRLRTSVLYAPGFKAPNAFYHNQAPYHRSNMQSMVPAEPVVATPVQPITAESIQSIKEIFPSIADDTIQTLLETHGGNMDEVTGELLRMSRET